ncbi:MAG: hypothetical protein H6799_00780 [Candidatus Nomurabacteria bacterium]|nr:MAG: hypothetical protein H6799_00780 [Candidatus Nomurabacteria bacterium]
MVSPNKSSQGSSREVYSRRGCQRGNADEARAKWNAALAGWNSKAGTLDSEASTWALNKGAELGVGTADDISAGTSLISQNLGAPGIIGGGAQPGNIGGALYGRWLQNQLGVQPVTL